MIRAGVLLSAVLCSYTLAAAQSTEDIRLVSAAGTGDRAGNGPSTLPRSSADGRFVVFTSGSSDLVPGDANGASDVFVRDLQQNTATLVSINGAGTGPGNGPSSDAFITPDGRHVVFVSEAGDLVAGDANGKKDVFVRDLVLQKTTLVSVNGAGTGAGAGESSGALITPDGRFVVFTSRANDLVAGDSNQTLADVFRRDMSAGTTVHVSRNAANSDGGDGDSSAPAITPDGRYVLFGSAATDLHGLDTNGATYDFFRRDLQTNTTALVTVNAAGTGGGNGAALTAVMSDDGQVVAFANVSDNLVPGAANLLGSPAVFARDFTTNTTTLMSLKAEPFRAEWLATSPRITPDGRYVFYIESARTPFGGFFPLPESDIVIRRDRLTLTGERNVLFADLGLCSQTSGTCPTRISSLIISADGNYAAYKVVERGLSPTSFTTALVLRETVGGFAAVFGQSVNSEEGLQFTPGNIVPGPKLFFSSAVSHSGLDANAAEDVYLFAPPQGNSLALTESSRSLREDGVGIIFGVRRTGFYANSTATVEFATSDGTATAGSDYTPTSGTLTFGPGEAKEFIEVLIISDDIVEPGETLSLTLSNPTGTGATLGAPSTGLLTIIDDDEYTLNFSGHVGSVSETVGATVFSLMLAGGTPHPPISVTYSTVNGTASDRSDYTPDQSRTLHFAPEETIKNITILLTDDAYKEDLETFYIRMDSSTGAKIGAFGTMTFIIESDDASDGPNPVDGASFDAEFFVRQHYHDFLNREPDPDGFAFWVNQITECETRPAAERQACREIRRINVSAAFFLSIEFQETGFLVYRAHQAAFDTGGQIRQRGDSFDFLPATQEVGRGVRIGQPGAEELLERNQQVFFNEFVEYHRFLELYPRSMTPAQFVDALNLNTGGSLSPAERDALVDGLTSGALTRGQAFRAACEDEDFRARERNRAFVLMQYLGYLRRYPDAAPEPKLNFDGYNFWLGKLNDHDGNFITAQMVEAFITSGEYRRRFGL